MTLLTTRENELQNNEIDLRELFLVFWESKALILSIAFIAILLAAAYAMLVTPV
ncbi:hypothetical protein CDEF62S_02691 [Castellaniella defragrans]